MSICSDIYVPNLNDCLWAGFFPGFSVLGGVKFQLLLDLFGPLWGVLFELVCVFFLSFSLAPVDLGDFGSAV